jgi:hypothetical protein
MKLLESTRAGDSKEDAPIVVKMNPEWCIERGWMVAVSNYLSRLSISATTARAT